MSQDQQLTKPREFVSVDPYGKEQARYGFESDEQILEKIKIGNTCFQQYKQSSFEERRQKLIKLAEILEKNAEEDAKIISQEIGKPFQQALGEVKKSASHCRFYAQEMENYLKPKVFQEQGAKQVVLHEPLGAIYIITPFNFPHWQIFKPAIGNLALGNTLLVRTADSTPLVGLNVEKRFEEAGFKGLYQNVFSAPGQLDLIISNPMVKGLSFTGSSGAGAYIASVTSKYLKKSVMELGGSDPFIVLPDADVDLAADLAFKGRLLNCGQVCIASKRFLISENIYEVFMEKLTEKVKNVKIGYPLEEGVFIGPMARTDLLEGIEKQIQKSVDQGARILHGGKRIQDKPGNFMEPTILEINNLENSALKDEMFGPVFVVYKVQSGQEAVDIANSSEYGLGGVVVGQDKEEAQRIANQLECGMSFVNTISKTDSRFPVGGCKQSGFGRECGEFGITEFSNIRLRWVQEE